jgi:AraC-like DNA-binding protein
MPQLGRSAGLTGFVEVAREAGLDPYRLAVSAGLPRTVFSNPELMVSMPAMNDLVERAAQASGLEDFALRMASHRRLSTMGPLGLAIRQQPSLRAALRVMIDYGWIYNDALHLSFSEDGDMGMLLVGSPTWGGRTSSELVMASLFQMARDVRGAAWRPLEVGFMHARPADPEPYRRFFGVAPRFEQDFMGMVVDCADLDTPITGTDPAMAEEALRILNVAHGQRLRSMSDRVRDALYARLSEGACSVERIAEQLGMDRRTLHRRLSAETASYTELMMEVRRNLAQSLLATSDRPLSDIAETLGFSSLSVFAHWFRRSFGCTASVYRAQHGVEVFRAGSDPAPAAPTRHAAADRSLASRRT